MPKSNKFKEYNDLNVRFLYPNNWTVQTQTWDRGTYGITVDSPDGSFWSLAIFPPEVNLDNAAEELIKEIQIEYDEMDKHEVKRCVADYVLEGIEIDYFCLDVACSVQALKFKDEERGYVVFWQTGDRMFLSDDGEDVNQSDVLKVITHTLISSLTGQDYDLYEEVDEALSRRSERETREEENREYLRRRLELQGRRVGNESWRRGEGYVQGFQPTKKDATSLADEELEDFMRDETFEFDDPEDDEFEDDFKDEFNEEDEDDEEE